MYQKSIQNFILEYSDFDTNKLRFKNIQADFDVAWAIQQISKQKKKKKGPFNKSKPVKRYATSYLHGLQT